MKSAAQKHPILNRKYFTIALLILIAFEAGAQNVDLSNDLALVAVPVIQAEQAAQEEEEPCPNPKKLRGMCMFVGSKTDDSQPQGKYRYLYQRRLLEAACVDLEKDSEEEIGRKISAMWKQYEDTLICNNTQFDVSNGSVIKYAVNVQFDVFIFELAEWGVNFNKVDETDGRTVLDYVQYQINRSKGLAIEDKLKQYYAALRDSGAKHKSEL